MAKTMAWHVAGSQYPLRLLAIDYTKMRDALKIVVAQEGRDYSDTGGVFDPTSELGALWLTLKAAKMNVVSMNLMLQSDKLDEDGKAIRIEADIRNPEKPEFGYAYSAKQIAAFPVPKNLHVRAQVNLRGAPPLFMVGMLPYKAKPRTNGKSAGLPKPAIVRVSEAPAEPKKPAIARQG